MPAAALAGTADAELEPRVAIRYSEEATPRAARSLYELQLIQVDSGRLIIGTLAVGNILQYTIELVVSQRPVPIASGM